MSPREQYVKWCNTGCAILLVLFLLAPLARGAESGPLAGGPTSYGATLEPTILAGIELTPEATIGRLSSETLVLFRISRFLQERSSNLILVDSDGTSRPLRTKGVAGQNIKCANGRIYTIEGKFIPSLAAELGLPGADPGRYLNEIRAYDPADGTSVTIRSWEGAQSKSFDFFVEGDALYCVHPASGEEAGINDLIISTIPLAEGNEETTRRIRDVGGNLVPGDCAVHDRWVYYVTVDNREEPMPSSFIEVKEATEAAATITVALCRVNLASAERQTLLLWNQRRPSLSGYCILPDLRALAYLVMENEGSELAFSIGLLSLEGPASPSLVRRLDLGEWDRCVGLWYDPSTQTLMTRLVSYSNGPSPHYHKIVFEGK